MSRWCRLVCPGRSCSSGCTRRWSCARHRGCCTDAAVLLCIPLAAVACPRRSNLFNSIQHSNHFHRCVGRYRECQVRLNTRPPARVPASAAGGSESREGEAAIRPAAGCAEKLQKIVVKQTREGVCRVAQPHEARGTRGRRGELMHRRRRGRRRAKRGEKRKEVERVCDCILYLRNGSSMNRA